jgi:pimeloyl-ACP methyl ester carboxylesterase
VDVIRQSPQIPAAGVMLDSDIVVPERAHGLVLFAHGSGSSRKSPRNLYVAGELQGARLATVLADLLTPAEDRIDAVTAELRFDVSLLAGRVAALCDWLVEHDPTAGLGIGLFGASTGAAAALMAAAVRPVSVSAVVSRGGRPDLAGPALRSVHQPTLLIVGERDPVVLDLNRQAMQELPGETQLEVVPGATHLFEEAGTLEQAARLARDWFVRRLRPVAPGHQIVDGLGSDEVQ